MLRTSLIAAAAAVQACSGGTEPISNPPVALAIVTQPSPEARSGILLERQPVIQLVDSNGQPVAAQGVTVRAVLSSGAGELFGVTSLTAASGRATFTALGISGSVGTFTVRFESGAFTPDVSEPIQLLAGNPGTLKAVIGTGPWVASLGGRVTNTLSFYVTDEFENPVPGVVVSFAIVAGGGALDQTALTTNGSGTTPSPVWTTGLAPGENRLRATVPGVQPVEVSVTGVALPASGIIASAFVSCAVNPQGQGWCWGENGNRFGTGQLSTSLPVSVGLGQTLVQSKMGGAHGCRLISGGEAQCSGFNDDGQLGNGTTSPLVFDVPVAGGHLFTALALGAYHTCGVRTDGRVLCWGRNFQGQLGFEGPNALIPTLVPGTGYAAITASGNHTCTVDVTGSAWCWGDNGAGQLGDGTLANRSEPTRVSGGHTWVTVSTGTNHTCGITAGGTAYCWGQGAEGQLGTGGTPILRPAPTEVSGGHVFTRISAGDWHTCGITNVNLALCWGANNWAQLGDGSLTSRLSPTAVAGGLKFLEITTGYDHSCGIVAGGWAFCWGLNTYGQLGERALVNFSTKPIGVFPPDALSAIVATPGTSTRVGVRGLARSVTGAPQSH